MRFYAKKWSGLRGSNPPPRPWQGRALPNELNPRNFADSVYQIMIRVNSYYSLLFSLRKLMMPPVGIEPTTRGFSVAASRLTALVFSDKCLNKVNFL